MKPSFAIVGCGKVGISLGKFLKEAGYPVAGLASKSLSSAGRAAEIIGTGHFSQTPWEITKKAEVVFITTPDGAITGTCNAIAQNDGFSKGAVVLHCSGALPSTILSSAGNCGALTGSMHPLQSFASAKIDENPFLGIIISIEGENGAVSTAKEMATDLGAISFTIRTEAKTLYHASAVVASNYLVTLLDLSFKLIGEAGITGTDAIKVLYPLIEGTLSNIKSAGVTKALTGPVERGDVDTVERHVKEIQSKMPDLLGLYKILGLHTIDIARAKETLSETSAERLKNILG